MAAKHFRCNACNLIMSVPQTFKHTKRVYCMQCGDDADVTQYKKHVYKRFTDAEKEIVKRIDNHLKVHLVAKELGRTVDSVRKQYYMIRATV